MAFTCILGTSMPSALLSHGVFGRIADRQSCVACRDKRNAQSSTVFLFFFSFFVLFPFFFLSCCCVLLFPCFSVLASFSLLLARVYSSLAYLVSPFSCVILFSSVLFLSSFSFQRFISAFPVFLSFLLFLSVLLSACPFFFSSLGFAHALRLRCLIVVVLPDCFVHACTCWFPRDV